MYDNSEIIRWMKRNSNIYKDINELVYNAAEIFSLLRENGTVPGFLYNLGALVKSNRCR